MTETQVSKMLLKDTEYKINRWTDTTNKFTSYNAELFRAEMRRINSFLTFYIKKKKEWFAYSIL